MPQVRTARKKNRRSDKRTNQKLGRRSDKRTNQKIKRRSDKRTNQKLGRRSDKRTNQKVERRRSDKRTNKKIRMREDLRVNNVMVGGEEDYEIIFEKIFPKFVIDVGNTDKKTFLENFGLIHTKKNKNKQNGSLVARLTNQINNLKDLYDDSEVGQKSPIHFYFENIINPLFYYTKVYPNPVLVERLKETEKEKLFSKSFDEIENYEKHEKYFKNHLKIISLFIELYDKYKNANLTEHVNIGDYLDISEIQTISNNFKPVTGMEHIFPNNFKDPWHSDHNVNGVFSGDFEESLNIFPNGGGPRPHFGHYIHTFVNGKLRYKYNPNIFGNFPRFCKHKLYFGEIELSEGDVKNKQFIHLIKRLHTSFQNYIKSSIYSIYVLIENRNERNEYMKTFNIEDLLDVYYYIKNYLVGQQLSDLEINTIKLFFEPSEQSWASWTKINDPLKKYISFLFEIHLNNDKIFYMLEALHGRTKIKYKNGDIDEIIFKTPNVRSSKKKTKHFTYGTAPENIPENKFPERLKETYNNPSLTQKGELKGALEGPSDFSNYLKHPYCHKELFEIFTEKVNKFDSHQAPVESHYPLYGFKLSDDCIINSSQKDFTDAVDKYGFDEYAYDLFMNKSTLNHETLHEILIKNALVKQSNDNNKIIFPILIPIKKANMAQVYTLKTKEYVKQFIINKMEYAYKGEYTFVPNSTTIIPTIKFYKDIVCDDLVVEAESITTAAKNEDTKRPKRRKLIMPPPDGGGKTAWEVELEEDGEDGEDGEVSVKKEQNDIETIRTIIGGLLSCYGDEESFKNVEAEKKRVLEEAEAAKAEAEEVKKSAEQAKAEAEAAREEAAQAAQEAEAVKEKAEAAQEETITKLEEAEVVKVQAEAQAERILKEAQELKAQAETEKAEAEKAVEVVKNEALEEAEVVKVQAEAQAKEAEAEAERLLKEAQELKAQAETEKAEAEKAVEVVKNEALEEAELVKLKAEAQAKEASAEAKKAQEETQRRLEEGKAEAEEVKKLAEQAKAEAEAAQAEAKKAQEETQRRLEEGKAEAEEVKKSAEQAQAEVEIVKTKLAIEETNRKKLQEQIEQQEVTHNTYINNLKGDTDGLREAQQETISKLENIRVTILTGRDAEGVPHRPEDIIKKIETNLNDCKKITEQIGEAGPRIKGALDGYVGYIKQIKTGVDEYIVSSIPCEHKVDGIKETIDRIVGFIEAVNGDLLKGISKLLSIEDDKGGEEDEEDEGDVEGAATGGGYPDDLKLDILNYNHELNGGAASDRPITVPNNYDELLEGLNELKKSTNLKEVDSILVELRNIADKNLKKLTERSEFLDQLENCNREKGILEHSLKECETAGAVEGMVEKYAQDIRDQKTNLTERSEGSRIKLQQRLLEKYSKMNPTETEEHIKNMPGGEDMLSLYQKMVVGEEGANRGAPPLQLEF